MKKKNFFYNSYFILSLTILTFTVYKSEIQWSGNIRDYYFKYYILSLILFLISSFYFFLSFELKKYFNIIFAAIVISVYSFELYTSVLERDNILEKSIKAYEKNDNKKFDVRTKIEILKELQKDFEKVTLVVKPHEFKNIYTFAGISKHKTIFCNENGYYALYESDRYGFNNPDQELDETTVEYLLVGDSFLHGSCVNRPDDISSIIRNFSKKPVINLGFQGVGPLIEYALLKEYFPKNVKKILWFYYEGNDLIDLNRELKSDLLRKYFNEESFSQDLYLKQDFVDKKLIDLIKYKEIEKKTDKTKIYFDKFIKILKLSTIRELLLPKHRPGKDFIKIMSKVKKFSDKNNSKLYFIYLPEYSRYRYNLRNTSYSTVKSIIQNLGIEFIDIDQEVFENLENPLSLFPFELPGHYNVNGYYKVGKKVYELTK